MDRDLLEGMLAEGLSLAAIGRRVGRHESTVADYLSMYGLRPVNAERHGARGGLTREQLEPLVEAGMSIAEVAAELDRSKTTVRHWLAKHVVTALLWDSYRLLAIGTFTGLFLAIGIVAALLVYRKLHSGPRLFAASLDELAQDRAALQGQAPSDNRPSARP